MNDWRDEEEAPRRPKPCPDNCPCRQDDAMTTPIDLEDIE